MTDDEVEGMAARTNGSGQSVNVSVSGLEGIKYFAIVLAIFFLAMMLCIWLAARADDRADDAYEAAARAQRQADLANWTMNNLEGLIVQHGIQIPATFMPHNLTIQPKEHRK